MNENRRLLIVGLVILGLIGLILAVTFWPKADNTFICGVKKDGEFTKVGSLDYGQYQCLIKSDKKNAIVYTKEITKEKKKVLNAVATKLGHAIYYLNMDKINKNDLKEITKKLKYQDKSFKEEVVLVINKGKVLDFKEKILTNENDLYNFLKDSKLAKFACDVKASEEYENLGKLTYEQYNCLYESDLTYALVVSQTTCGYCAQFKPVINEYAGKNDIPVYFIEVDQLSQNERNALLASLSYFNENSSWGTPLTLGIQNKEVKANISGFTEDTKELDNFFGKINLK